MKVMAVLLIVDACVSIQIGAYRDVCTKKTLLRWIGNEKIVIPFVNHIKVWAASFQIDPAKNEYKIAGILFCSNSMTYYFLVGTFLMLNFGLAWDMWRSHTNPFESVESRQKVIYFSSQLLFFVIMPIYWFAHWISGMKTIGESDSICGDVRFSLMMRPGESVAQMIFFVYGTVACFMVGVGIIRKKGLNNEIRKVILARYIRYEMILYATQWPTYYYYVSQYISREFSEEFKVFG
jgi:hypothetical protein